MKPSVSAGNHPPRLKVLIVAAHDSLGGAARAIFRVYSALKEFHSDTLDVTLRVANKTVDDPGIIGGKPTRSRMEYVRYYLRTRFRKYFPRKPFVTQNPVLHSQALYDTGLGREINSRNPDVVLMGWLGGSTISIREIGKIKAPIVWRMSDLWVVAGAEHLTQDPRYAKGYSRKSRPDGESGPDINRETFLRKKRWWRNSHRIVALSQWQARQASVSTLTKSWPVDVIPVPIDPEDWAARDQSVARKSLGLTAEPLLVGFGAGQATKHRHKGADLLFEALQFISSEKGGVIGGQRVELVIFGEEENTHQETPLPTHFLGKLDNAQLADVYSAIDVLVAPSRQESFGQVAAEAQTCGAPAVVFDNSGLADVVEDFSTGRIVPAFDTRSLAESIEWVLEDEGRREELSRNARERAVRLWNPEVVANQYAKVLTRAALRQV